MNENLMPNAQIYAARRQLEIAEPLGSGKDGIVMVAKRKAGPGKVAIKALRWPEPYQREKMVYERLKEIGITDVRGFNVPQFLGAADDLRVIEISIVTRPFVLDFAGTYLNAPPEFPNGVMEDWEADQREKFETRWPEVQAVMSAFEEFGIYLLDISPANIAF
jgi:hypothetical protein